MEEEHKLKDNIPPWEIIVTTGSQDGLSKTFDLLTNEGDYVITENPTYRYLILLEFQSQSSQSLDIFN